MPRSNGVGKSIRSVLSWILDRNIEKQEMAVAIGVHPAVFSRRIREDDFPTFEELAQLGVHFQVPERVLQIAFGLRSEDEVVLLSDAEREVYIEQGGALPTVK